MTNQPSIDNIFAAAVNMYHHLRQSGQTSQLARISVESRYTTLTNAQRQLLRQMIANTESTSISPSAAATNYLNTTTSCLSE